MEGKHDNHFTISVSYTTQKSRAKNDRKEDGASTEFQNTHTIPPRAHPHQNFEFNHPTPRTRSSEPDIGVVNRKFISTAGLENRRLIPRTWVRIQTHFIENSNCGSDIASRGAGPSEVFRRLAREDFGPGLEASNGGGWIQRRRREAGGGERAADRRVSACPEIRSTGSVTRRSQIDALSPKVDREASAEKGVGGLGAGAEIRDSWNCGAQPGTAVTGL
jgi:hypothetical protein